MKSLFAHYLLPPGGPLPVAAVPPAHQVEPGTQPQSAAGDLQGTKQHEASWSGEAATAATSQTWTAITASCRRAATSTATANVLLTSSTTSAAATATATTATAAA